MVSEFIEIVCNRDELQSKQLQKLELGKKEAEELENVLHFLTDEYQCGLDFLADSYLFVVNMIKEEQYYFVANGRYRNSTFEDVNRAVYQNQEYMEKYMIGLSLSDYLWKQHLKMISFFEDIIEKLKGDCYLEIGPGFGQYFIRAMQVHGYKKYLAVDISPTSVKKCQAYLKYCGIQENEYKVMKQNFFEFSSVEKFDFIVMGEVLEHVEDPLKMLQKIASLLKGNGLAYIATVINTPAIDHIYLFHSEKEVFDLVETAGFEVKSYICAPAGEMSMETAQKRNLSVNIAMLLSNKERWK